MSYSQCVTLVQRPPSQPGYGIGQPTPILCLVWRATAEAEFTLLWAHLTAALLQLPAIAC